MELFDFETGFLSLDSKSAQLQKELKWVATHRKTEFKEHVFNLKNYKSVAVKRGAAKTLFNIALKEDLERVEAWQNEEADRETWLILESLKDFLNLKTEEGEFDKNILTVSEALGLIRQNVGIKTFKIEGEIDEIKVYGKDFPAIFYMVLKGEDGQTMRVQFLEFIVAKLNFALNEGLSVRVTGNFKIGKSGFLFLDAINIELTGAGALAKNLKELEERLKNEGLMDEGRKRKLPKIARKILLIASPNSAAVTDYIKVLNERIGGAKIFLLPIKTQGAVAERIFLEQVEKVPDLHAIYNFDLCVITRGGGAKDDLVLFNSERVVRAIYGFPMPSLVAIGHERDVTLSELVADKRASTPSQAAEFTSLSKNEIYVITNQTLKNIHTLILNKTRIYEKVTGEIYQNILKILRFYVQRKKMNLQNEGWKIQNLVLKEKEKIKETYKNLIKKEREKLLLYETIDLPVLPVKIKLENHKSILNQDFSASLEIVKIQIEKRRNDLKIIFNNIENLNPEKIMKSGYVKLVKGEIKTGKHVTLENLEFIFNCEVKNVEKTSVTKFKK